MHDHLARSRIAIFTDPRFGRHDTGVLHPERAERLDAALDGARRAGFADRILGEATDHPASDRIIAKVHSPEYARELEAAVMRGARYFHSLDNPVSRGTPAAARAAVAATLTAADRIWNDHALERAFVVARPPGHHAERAQAMGFCFYNTIACAAEYLLERPDVKRIFILDWDVHHGNGTQHIFEARDDVFYASLHRFPFYPGTGAADEIGVDRGRGTTLNLPMNAGEGDAAYQRALEERIVPVMTEFSPDAILVSAGFDAHRSDPLGGMTLSELAFAELTRRVIEVADRVCAGRVLSLLEGGYDLEGLARCSAAHLLAMADE